MAWLSSVSAWCCRALSDLYLISQATNPTWQSSHGSLKCVLAILVRQKGFQVRFFGVLRECSAALESWRKLEIFGGPQQTATLSRCELRREALPWRDPRDDPRAPSLIPI